MTVLTFIAATLTGAALWTITEYVMHRFGFHHRGTNWLSRLIAAEHTRHHREPSKTNLGLRVAGHLMVAVAGLPFGIAVATVTTTLFGFTLWTTWALGYVAYEVGHWRLHHRPPTSRAGLRRRVHHMSHHGLNAATNFGVSFDWWDRVFSTTAPEGPVELADQIAPQWLRNDPLAYAPLALKDSQQTPS